VPAKLEIFSVLALAIQADNDDFAWRSRRLKHPWSKKKPHAYAQTSRNSIPAAQGSMVHIDQLLTNPYRMIKTN
jgi:hypothetical protein